MFVVLTLLTLLLLSLSCANGDECVGNEVRIIESPQPVPALLGSNESVAINCVGCGEHLSFNTSADDPRYPAVCGVQAKHENMYSVVEQNGQDPLNCTLYINTAFLNVSELLAQCKLGNSSYSIFSDIVTLTIQKNESSSHSLPASPTLTMDQTTTDTLNDAITSPNTTSDIGALDSEVIAAVTVVAGLALLAIIAVLIILVVLISRWCRKEHTSPPEDESFGMRSPNVQDQRESEERDSPHSMGRLPRFVQSDGGKRLRQRQGKR